MEVKFEAVFIESLFVIPVAFLHQAVHQSTQVESVAGMDIQPCQRRVAAPGRHLGLEHQHGQEKHPHQDQQHMVPGIKDRPVSRQGTFQHL